MSGASLGMAPRYEYYDSTDDCLITLKGRDKRALNAFFNALDRASVSAKNKGEMIHFGVVDEILDQLRGDPRFERP